MLQMQQQVNELKNEISALKALLQGGGDNSLKVSPNPTDGQVNVSFRIECFWGLNEGAVNGGSQHFQENFFDPFQRMKGLLVWHGTMFECIFYERMAVRLYSADLTKWKYINQKNHN